MYSRARVSLVSWEGRRHAVLFMVLLGVLSARPMAQVLQLPFEYYYYYYFTNIALNILYCMFH